MKLDRNINEDALGKYAVINLRKLNVACGNPATFQRWTPAVQQALKTLEEVGALEWGTTGAPDEFFLLKLKDKYAEPGLRAYAAAAREDDPEYADQVQELAARSGRFSPFCKAPD